jgi:hypothetical protein
MKTPAAFLAALALAGCGPGTQPERSTVPASSTQETAAPVSLDPAVQFFHDQLIANGEEVQSPFGTDLSTLGMNARDLQQDDPKHAYDTVLEKVRAIDDASVRREMMQTFFNRTDEP